MHLIVISDIFGNTSSLRQLVSIISNSCEYVEIIDPYQGASIDFKSEKEAYNYFQDNVGLEGYSKLLFDHLNALKSGPLFLLGFSIGGSALWALSPNLNSKNDVKAVCFYSSQVRNYLEIEPNCNFTFFLPESEPHFNIDDLHRQLSAKHQLTCIKTPYQHGFMNQLSAHFDRTGYDEYLQIIREYLANHSTDRVILDVTYESGRR